MKVSLTRILTCVIPIALSLVVIGWAYARYQEGRGGFRLGVDLVGGTILVYEVDETKGFHGEKGESFSAEELAARLKRRIDPADLYNITIRPIKGSPPRVEVILPTGGRKQSELEEKAWADLVGQVAAEYPEAEKGLQQVSRGDLNGLLQAVAEAYKDADPRKIDDFIQERSRLSKEKRQLTGEDIEQIKELIARQGALEFRILANKEDDKEAFAAAQAFFRDPANKEELERRALLGLPPPMAVEERAGKDGKKVRVYLDSAEFPAEIHNESGRFNYSWVEVGKEEMYSLGLQSASKDSPIAGVRERYKKIEEAREKGEPVVLDRGTDRGYGSFDLLLYSRAIPNPSRLLAKDRNDGKQFEYFLLTRHSPPGKEIKGDDLLGASRGSDGRGGLTVDFRLNGPGSNRFWDLTHANRPDQGEESTRFKRHLAIILDGQIKSAPTLNSAIRDRGQISGNFSPTDIDTLVRILRAGALPATIKPDPVSQNTMGATLGEDTIRAGTTAVFWAFMAVLAFMLIYYRFAGLVACIALFANLTLTVAFMVMVSATFTLPGLAGLVLTLGMAVDANILIYERLREERERGASLQLAIRNGYDRAFPTIIDTHLSSIFTAIVLYVVGNDQLKGFGVSLAVGLIISLFTSLYVTRTMFDFCLQKGWLKKLTMMQLFKRPNINFMAIRYPVFAATVALTVLGGALFLYKLDKGGLNIDFVGGTAYTGLLTKDHMVPMTDLRKDLEGIDLPEISIEQIFLGDKDYSEGDRSRLFTVRTTEKDSEIVLKRIVDKLGDKLQRVQLVSAEVAGAKPDDLVKSADLRFDDFASPAQVNLLLTRVFQEELPEAGVTFQLLGKGIAHERRYKEMQLTLSPSVKKAELEKVLKDVQERFANQPQPERLENFDAQLAASTQQRALYAVLASWGAILLYLWFRFGNWTFGLAAVFCLIHDLFFVLGIIAAASFAHGTFIGNALLLQDFKIDLPAVAALLTLVGYSVNDTIVVFDRIREVRGKNPALTPQMINDSINQTLSRTVLASLTTWLVVVVLYLVGGEGVHLFAFVMVMGVVVGTFSSIYVASPLLLMFGEGAHVRGARPRVEQPAATR